MKRVEIWRDVPEYIGVYQASQLGRVRSMARKVNRTDGKNMTMKSKVLSPGYYDGYQKIVLCYDKKMHTTYVHKVIAETWLRERPKGYDVNHIDGNKDNNCLENLEYITHQQNVQHAFDMGLARPMRGEDNPTSKITEKTAIEIKRLLNTGSYTCKKISNELNVSLYIVKDICGKRTWKHI